MRISYCVDLLLMAWFVAGLHTEPHVWDYASVTAEMVPLFHQDISHTCLYGYIDPDSAPLSIFTSSTIRHFSLFQSAFVFELHSNKNPPALLVSYDLLFSCLLIMNTGLCRGYNNLIKYKYAFAWFLLSSNLNIKTRVRFNNFLIDIIPFFLPEHLFSYFPLGPHILSPCPAPFLCHTTSHLFLRSPPSFFTFSISGRIY